MRRETIHTSGAAWMLRVAILALAPIERFATRCAPVFACTEYVTVPFPLPEVVTGVSHAAPLVTLQDAHPEVTVTV